MCKLLGIQKSRTTPYHPQSDGLVERTLLQSLATSAEDHPENWDEFVRQVCMAYNTSVHPTTGFMPFYLMFGWHAKWPVELFNVWCTQTVCQDTQGEAYARVRERATRQLECQKELYNKRIHGNPFKVGDHVWVLFPQAPRGKLRKLCRPWSCPFVVGKKLSCYAQSAGDKQSSLKNGHRF